MLLKKAIPAVVSLLFVTGGSVCLNACATPPNEMDTASAVIASPTTLGTPTQIAYEKQVLRIMQSPLMKAEIQRVEAMYAADPQGATPAGRATIKRAAEAIAISSAQYAVGEDTDRPGVFWAFNAPHDWFDVNFPRSGYGIENPDNVYRNIMVDGEARYRIRGRVNPQMPVQLHFELRDSIPGVVGSLSPEGGKQLATLNNSEMEIAADGTFTITVDSDPANGRSNHMQAPAQGELLLLVRDLFTDWRTQTPVWLDVQRVGGPAIRAARSDEQVAQRAAEILAKMAPFWMNYFNQYTYNGKANDLKAVRVRPGGRGMSAGGYFKLAADEALLLTLDEAGAKSLGVQLTDPWGVAYEYGSKTSSLNTRQATANADGTFTFVVSAKDPGIHNWLDPDGHEGGMLAIRWQEIAGDPRPEKAIREVKLVRLADLKRSLPAGATFVSLEVRKAQQQERLASYLRRLTE